MNLKKENLLISIDDNINIKIIDPVLRVSVRGDKKLFDKNIYDIITKVLKEILVDEIFFK